jgi:glycerol-3-phosphate O-acyltransferase
VWTDDDGKLDYDSTLEDMVRDARVILSREMRHSILKITPGAEREPADADQAITSVVAQTELPGDTSVNDLHQRHVEAEHQQHHPQAAQAPDQMPAHGKSEAGNGPAE